jgi:hypothetical protein
MPLKPSYHQPPDRYHKLDPEHSRNIAQAYEEMAHAPNDPAVKASYEQMIKETREQYRHIRQQHPDLKIAPIEPEEATGNPYEQVRHFREGTLKYFPTERGFGSGGPEEAGHPMMRESGEKLNGQPLLNNDLFRIVHDYFGHLAEGYGFRAAGEDNAWRAHASMYSDLARPAAGCPHRRPRPARAHSAG